MVNKAAAVGLLFASLLLAACTAPWPVADSTGYIRLIIARAGPGAQPSSPKAIPEDAEKIRIRVWRGRPAYNSVTTVTLTAEGQTIDIPIPAGDNYVVDVVSYKYAGYPFALTGGRASGVDVAADAVTEVAISLQAWDVDLSGPDEVAPEADYTLTFVPSDGGGLLTTDTFATATLRVSDADFADPAVPLPPVAGDTAHALDGRIDLSATAPDVDEETRMYALALVQFTQDWFDYALPDPAERSMFLELPNRHMGEELYQFTVKPALGGIVIVISGDR